VTPVTVAVPAQIYRRQMNQFVAAVVVPLIAFSVSQAPERAVAQTFQRAAAASYPWPVVGPLIRGFDPPDSPFGAGHRGIDITAPVGTTISAPAPGKVTFAGPVGGNLFLTIDHGNGLESTYSWLSALLVSKGTFVTTGQPIARTGWGHASDSVPHLHLGFKLFDVYVDPLDYLAPPSVSSFIRLAPLAA
jgi:murein DD-endopeptidase MepM/ murein hydrolase activator NlpD